MDECEEGSDDCDQDRELCLNSQGGFTCLERAQGRGSCPAGYKKDPAHRSGCTGEWWAGLVSWAGELG